MQRRASWESLGSLLALQTTNPTGHTGVTHAGRSRAGASTPTCCRRCTSSAFSRRSASRSSSCVPASGLRVSAASPRTGVMFHDLGPALPRGRCREARAAPPHHDSPRGTVHCIHPTQASPHADSVTTKELLDLAVAWKITASASEFWKTHRNRDDLLAVLQKFKYDRELESREAAKRGAGASPRPCSDAPRSVLATSEKRASITILTAQTPPHCRHLLGHGGVGRRRDDGEAPAAPRRGGRRPGEAASRVAGGARDPLPEPRDEHGRVRLAGGASDGHCAAHIVLRRARASSCIRELAIRPSHDPAA